MPLARVVARLLVLALACEGRVARHHFTLWLGTMNAVVLGLFGLWVK